MNTSSRLGELIGVFIGVVFGLALTPTVTSYANTIATDNNSSALVQLFAPYIPLFWILGLLGIAGAIMYKYLK